MTQPVSANPAAALAAQAEAAARARNAAENRKPPVEPLKDTQGASRYAERRAAREEGRGRNVDRDA